MKTKLIEGVPYHRHVVRYTTADGKRRRMVRWSPGRPWVYDEVGRELLDRFGADGIKPRSVTIVLATLLTFSSLACSGATEASTTDATPPVRDAQGATEDAPDAAPPSPCLPGCRCAPGYSVVKTTAACSCRAADGKIACTVGAF